MVGQVLECGLWVFRRVGNIMKGLMAHQPQPILGELRSYILTVIIWWLVGIPGLSIDHSEALSKMFLVV